MQHKVLAHCAFPHPDDIDRLEVVLAETDKDFVVWDHNKIQGGLSNGHYFSKSAAINPNMDSVELAKACAYRKFAQKIKDMVA